MLQYHEMESHFLVCHEGNIHMNTSLKTRHEIIFFPNNLSFQNQTVVTVHRFGNVRLRAIQKSSMVNREFIYGHARMTKSVF